MRYLKVVLAVLVCLAFGTGCGPTATNETPERGLYYVNGWGINGQRPTCYTPRYGSNPITLNIDGLVGYHLFVQAPNMRCEPGPGDLYAGTPIQSGHSLSLSLPPGLQLDNGGNIVGIPLSRGHWIVKAAIQRVVCDGKYYGGHISAIPKDEDNLCVEELDFHITGTGRVVE